MNDLPLSPQTDARAGPGRIVSLFRSAPDGQEAGLNLFLDYWRGLCRGGDVPRRADIDPRRIEPVLANTFILERIAPGLARFRVAGTHLAELMGMDVRGMPVSTLILPGARDGFADGLQAVFSGPARLHLRLRAKGALGRPDLSARMLILPLRSDRGEVSRAIGCLVTRGQPGRAPRRFSILRSRVVPLCASPAAPRAAPARFDPARPNPAHPPYLRLVKSD